MLPCLGDLRIMGWGLVLAFWMAASTGCVGLVREWVETEETIELSTTGIATVAAVTDNGSIRGAAADTDDEPLHVRVRIRAGGINESDAAACRDAIEVITPTSGDAAEVQEIRWQWKQPKQPTWQANVSYEITMPARLALRATTHNGEIEAEGLRSTCHLETHNGQISVHGATGALEAESHNGSIDANSDAEHVVLHTHNGEIDAELASSTTLSGEVITHNGNVDVSLSTDVSVDLECRTHNGRVESELELTDQRKKGRKALAGTLGQGGKTLVVRSHNGSVSLDGSVSSSPSRKR